MRSRRVLLFQLFRRRICPRLAGWLIAMQLLPLSRVQARTPPTDTPPGIASTRFAAASSIGRASAWARTSGFNDLLTSLKAAAGVSDRSLSAITPDISPPTSAASPVSTAVNRTVPNVAAPTPFSSFSSSPSDQEFFRGRIFEEPLVPIGRATTLAENRALAGALETYRRGAPDATVPIDAFLHRHPDTSWRASLLVNVGVRLRDAGAYTRALAMWDEAWTLAQDATDPHGRATADLALAEWLQLSASLMRVEQVEARLASIGGRDVRGTPGNRIAQVRQRLAWWRARPESFVPAELRALERLSSFVRNGDSRAASSSRVSAANTINVKAPRRLGWLIGPAKKLGLALRAMRRGVGAPFAAHTLVTMKNGRVLALLEARGDRFLAYDPILNRDLFVSRATLDEEASGYALMSRTAIEDAGWMEVAAAALPMQEVACDPGTPDFYEPCPPCSNGGADPGMPTYRLHHAIAGLVIQDEPVTYPVPRGPAARLGLSYGSRSVDHPAVFTFGNFGPKWRFDWLAYIQEHPVSCWNGACGDAELRVTLRGGGHESYEPPAGSWTTLGPHWRSHAIIVRTSSSPLQYERRLPDGSKEVYGVSEGTFNGARLFLTDLVDPQGQTVHLTYDGQFRLVSLTDAIGQVTTLSYEHATDPLKITKVTDPFGRFATFTYNGAGQLESITDAIGLTSTFSYGKNDFIASMTTPYGTTTFRQEDIYALTPLYLEATDPLGGTERVEYWMEHPSLPATVPTSEVPAGFTAANHYLNRYVGLYWDKRAMALQPRALASATVTKWLLREPGADYSGGAPNTSIPYSIKGPLEGRVWYQYPNQYAVGSESVGMGMQPSVTARVLDDGSSQIWQATYNTLGHVTSRTDPIGRRTSFVYAANGIDLLEVRQTTGSLNDLLATYSNYVDHRAQTITDAAGGATVLTYDTAGRLTTSTNAKGEITTYTYDTAGTGVLQSVSRAAAGSTTSFTYDSYGRVRTVTQPDGYTVTTDYDLLGRPTKLTYPDGTFDSFAYDRLDLVELGDRLGRRTHRTYDRLRRLVASTDPLGRTVTQHWCACGTLDKVVDANGRATTWERDARGRVTREVRSDGTNAALYTYETKTSRLKTITDAKGQITTYAFNLDDTTQSVTYTGSAVATPGVTLAYDSTYLRLTSFTDGTGTTMYTYKPVGGLGANKVSTIDGPLGNDTIAYDYDELGRMTVRTVNGVSSTWSFDTLGRVSSESDVLGTFTYAYHGSSRRLATLNYPNGQTTTYSYFPSTGDQRLQTIHHLRPGGVTLSRFDYTYDKAGNVLTWRQQADAGSPVEWRYAYDASNQLLRGIKSSTATPAATLQRYAYAYDVTGNRVSEQIDDVVATAEFDSLGRMITESQGGALRVAGLVSETATVEIQGKPATVGADQRFEGTAVVAPGTTAFSATAKDASGNTSTANYEVNSPSGVETLTYDANGNVESDSARGYEWDAANRLTAIVEGTQRIEYSYNAFDQRTKAVYKDGATVTRERWFVWCDTLICEERATNGSTVTKRFLSHGVQDSGTSHYFTRDHLGSVAEVVDGSLSLSARYAYDPYGRRVRVSGSYESDFGYTGHFTEDAANLVLTLYRVYSPDRGRWLSVDPLFASSPEAHANMTLGGRHPYGYVLNNPLRYADQYGLDGGAASATFTIVITCSPDPWTKAFLLLMLAAGVVVTVIYVCKNTDEPKREEEQQPNCPVPPPKSGPYDDFGPDERKPEHPKYPGDDPAKSPGSDWEWRGKPEKGNYYNPNTKESLHPDLAHPKPIGPHWDYRDRDKVDWRIFPDGSVRRK